MKKKIYLVLSTALAVAMLTGCGGGGNQPSGSQSESGAAGSASGSNSGAAVAEGGKVITYSIEKEPETIDPGKNNYSDSSTILQNLFTGLYQVGPEGSLVAGCADSYELSDDGLVYTFTLKDGLKWSDGSDLTAHDFEYSWKRTLNQETASPGAWYLFYLKNGEAFNAGETTEDQVGVIATDDKTLVVTLENPTSYFLDLTAVSVFFPVKKDAVEGGEVWTKTAETYVSNGAFMMSKIKPQEGYEMVKNPNYLYAEDVKLDGLNVVFIESKEAALSAYNAGEIDVIEKPGAQAQQQFADSEELHSFNSIGTCYYDFNCEKEYLADPNVRKALSMAINRDTINQSVIQNKPQSAYAYVPYGIPYGDQDEEYRDVVGDLLTEDVDQAKALLAEAGYPNGEGFPKITILALNDQERKDTAQVMQAMWKENLGIESEIVTYESKVYWEEFYLGNYDVAYDGWTGDYPDPSTNLDCFIASRRGNQNRWSGAEAEKYDQLMEENLTLVDNQKRMENFAAAEKILMDEMPIMPLYYRNAQLLIKPNCTNVFKSYIGHTMFKFADKQ